MRDLLVSYLLIVGTLMLIAFFAGIGAWATYLFLQHFAGGL